MKINRKILEQILSLKGEVEDLKDRLNNGKENIITDSVRGSSKEYPYVQHNMIIEGIDYKQQIRDKKYRRMIKQKQDKINKLIREAEYCLDNIEDSDIRQIIRYVYFDAKDYNQTAHIMNRRNPKGRFTADNIRMKLKRFFEKN